MEVGWRTGDTGAEERGFIGSCEALGESEHGSSEDSDEGWNEYAK